MAPEPYATVGRTSDALVEDLLDRAELTATGRLARPARWPRWLPLANRIEVALRP